MKTRSLRCLACSVFALVLASSAWGCSLSVRDNERLLLPDPPSAPTVTMSPEAPKHADIVTAFADGSVDPGATEVHYRFEWLYGENPAPLRTQEVSTAQDTFDPSPYRGDEWKKGETWTVRVTPISEDGREGEATDHPFSIANTPSTIGSIALGSYQPVTDEVVRAALVGYKDVDGDLDAVTLRWEVAGQVTETPVSNLEAQLDLSEYPLDFTSDELTVEALPIDDDGEPLMRLGPLGLLENVTQWRTLSRNLQFGIGNLSSVAGWDSKHRRFLALSGLVLWEHSEQFGFAQLYPTGDAPTPTQYMQATYDDTPGAERLLVLAAPVELSPPPESDPAEYTLYTLSLTDRGQEHWTAMPAGPGPVQRCWYAMHYDQDSQQLIVMGGRKGRGCPITGSLTGETWLLDLSAPGEARWTDNSPIDILEPLQAATAVQHPSKPNTLILMGGTTLGPPPPFREVKYPEFSVTELPGTLTDNPMGVLAFPDADRNRVVGGLGLTTLGEPVNRVWEYDLETGRVSTRNAESVGGVIEQLDTTLGAFYGVGGLDGDKITFWPGMTDRSTFATMTFRTGSILLDMDVPEWRSELTVGVTVPWSPGPVTSVGVEALVAQGADNFLESYTTAFLYDFERNTWTTETGPSPLEAKRTGVFGGYDSAGQLWLAGGVLASGDDADMLPWRFDAGAWEQSTITGPTPAPRSEHNVFATGCGATAPIGIVGGERPPGGSLVDETWILRCPAGTSPCAWESLSGGTLDTLRSVATAYDGNSATVLFGGWNGSEWSKKVYVLDACETPASDWQLATVNMTEGMPTPGEYDMLLTPPDTPGDLPGFLLVPTGPQGVFAIERDVWRLRQTAELDYAFERLEVPTKAPLGIRRIAWDDTTRRVVAFGDGSAVWELRLRD